MKKKLIIFDLDNTLFKSKDSYKYIIAEILKERWNIDPELAAISHQNAGKEMKDTKEYPSLKEFYKEFNLKFLKKIIKNPTEKQVKEFDKILEYMKELVPIKLKTYENVLEVLTNLKKKGYKLAILTGTWEKKIKSFEDPKYAQKKKEILEKLLKNSLLDKIIDKLFITYEYSIVKPNPESFKIVLKYFGVKPSEAIMVGDKEADLLASKIGISPILFDPKNKYDGKTTPDYTITHFLELEPIIENYN